MLKTGGRQILRIMTTLLKDDISKKRFQSKIEDFIPYLTGRAPAIFSGVGPEAISLVTLDL